MSLPQDLDARDYYRSAQGWLADATFMLREANRSRAAVYLAGYTVECLLKALILSHVPRKKREELKKRRDFLTHDLLALKALYLSHHGFSFPKSVASDLVEVSSWDPASRYRPGPIKYQYADAFLQAVERISLWADGRL